MNSFNNIVLFIIFSVLFSVLHFALSGDTVIISATGEAKFHLTPAEKWLESGLIGSGASVLIIALLLIVRILRK